MNSTNTAILWAEDLIDTHRSTELLSIAELLTAGRSGIKLQELKINIRDDATPYEILEQLLWSEEHTSRALEYITEVVLLNDNSLIISATVSHSESLHLGMDDKWFHLTKRQR